jgi:hypothetical protein
MFSESFNEWSPTVKWKVDNSIFKNNRGMWGNSYLSKHFVICKKELHLRFFCNISVSWVVYFLKYSGVMVRPYTYYNDLKIKLP